MKIAVIAAGLTLLVAAPGFAQTAPPPPAEAVTPAKLELARQLIEASGGLKQMNAIIDSMYGAMFPRMAQSLPKEARGSFKSAQDTMQREMHEMMPKILQVSERVYAETFTEDELRQVLAFQQSPAGQAMVRKTPVMMQRSMTEMVPVIMAEMPKIMHGVTQAVCDEQHCTETQRHDIEAALNAALKPQAAAGA